MAELLSLQKGKLNRGDNFEVEPIVVDTWSRARMAGSKIDILIEEQASMKQQLRIIEHKLTQSLDVQAELVLMPSAMEDMARHGRTTRKMSISVLSLVVGMVAWKLLQLASTWIKYEQAICAHPLVGFLICLLAIQAARLLPDARLQRASRVIEEVCDNLVRLNKARRRN